MYDCSIMIESLSSRDRQMSWSTYVFGGAIKAKEMQ